METIDWFKDKTFAFTSTPDGRTDCECCVFNDNYDNCCRLSSNELDDVLGVERANNLVHVCMINHGQHWEARDANGNESDNEREDVHTLSSTGGLEPDSKLTASTVRTLQLPITYATACSWYRSGNYTLRNLALLLFTTDELKDIRECKLKVSLETAKSYYNSDNKDLRRLVLSAFSKDELK